MSETVCDFCEYWKTITSAECEKDEMLMFRGHSRKDYQLMPSAFRCNEADNERNSYRNIMLEYPEEFKTRAHLSNLVKMQHYGCATRLLDLTRNPLIALYFACETNPEKDGEVIVFRSKKAEILHHNSDKALMLACLPCFSTQEQKEIAEFCKSHRRKITDNDIKNSPVMKRFLHEIRGEYPSFECEIIGEDLLKNYFAAPFKDNERMQRQDGMFMIFGLTDKVDNKTILKKIRINRKCKKNILRDLKLAGISNASVYPGLERKAMELAKKRIEWTDTDGV